MDVVILASGSAGNATLIRSGGASVLIDAGLSAREILRRLALAGASRDGLGAVVLSHEHSDHVAGATVLSRRLGIPLYANPGTAERAFGRGGAHVLQTFTTGRAFRVGGFELTPFPVSHDAEDPVGFAIDDGSARVGMATDLGSLTLDAVAGLEGCDAVVIESNHDESMLLEGPYPRFLKERVWGPLGHLSNDDAAELVRAVLHPGLRHVALAHLSRTNNEPPLPVDCVRRALGKAAPRVEITVGAQYELRGPISL